MLMTAVNYLYFILNNYTISLSAAGFHVHGQTYFDFRAVINFVKMF